MDKFLIKRPRLQATESQTQSACDNVTDSHSRQPQRGSDNVDHPYEASLGVRDCDPAPDKSIKPFKAQKKRRSGFNPDWSSQYPWVVHEEGTG